jgi:hypothetical protein
MIVAIPLIMIASWALKPMRIGKTKVAPNIATTCCAPSPIVLPHDKRSSGATTSPGASRCPSPLSFQPNAAMGVDPFPSRVKSFRDYSLPRVAGW